jgi:Cu/Ag efflux pump CusA
LPQRISQRRDVLVPKERDAVFIHSVPVCLLGMLVSFLGVLKSLPGALLSGLVILFFMGFRSATMSVGGTIVQLGSSLMIFVV